MHIEAKKEASKRPWVAGFVYLGRFRRRACPSLRRIGAVTCQRKQGSGREERHEERAGEKEEARQGAARSRWGAPSCRAGIRVSASFIVGFVRVVIVGQEWLRQVQQSSRTRGTDSIGDAICLMVLQLLSARFESRVRVSEK